MRTRQNKAACLQPEPGPARPSSKASVFLAASLPCKSLPIRADGFYGGPIRDALLKCSPSVKPSEAGPPKLRLFDQVRATIRTRHYSLRTEKSYVAWIRRYIVFHGKRHPAEMGVEEIRHFLTWLAVDGKVAAATQNQAMSALLFFHREVLQQEVPWLDGVVRAKSPQRLPVVLTRDEVRTVVERLHGVPRLMALLFVWRGRPLAGVCPAPRQRRGLQGHRIRLRRSAV